MFKNYLAVALRNLRKHKGLSLINVSGLAVGMACCTLILFWIQHEHSYDRFHKKGERIYKVTIESHRPDGSIDPFSETQFPLAPTLKDRYPDIEDAARIFKTHALVRYGSTAFNENLVFFTDTSFFELFSFPFLSGNPENALSDTNAIVITENTAQKYFGAEDPMGKIMSVNVKRDFVVTGVLKNPPSNSHIQFDFLLPASLLTNLDRNTLRQEWDASSLNSWGATYVDTYVQIGKSVSFPDVEQKIFGFLSEVKLGTAWKLRMQPLFEVYLHPINGSNTVVKYLTIFAIIACVVLVIACINFMNLTTACSSKRAKEIGMRKVVGARKKDVIQQFFGESLLTAFLASGLAVLLVALFLPTFNRLSGKQLTFSGSFSLSLFMGFLGITILTGCLSAVYPALHLSSLKTLNIIKRSAGSGAPKSQFRKVLVVAQFSLSIIFIIGTIVIFSQLEYIRKKDLGYNRSDILYLPIPGELQNTYALMKREMEQNPQILAITASNVRPSFLDTGAGGLDWEGKDPNLDASYSYASVDFNFIETLGMEIGQGRNFSREITSDSSNYILNETAIKEMGLTDPIEKRFSMWGTE